MRTLLVALTVSWVAALGVGCTASKSPPQPSLALASAEARVAKLERDLALMASARDSLALQLKELQKGYRTLETRQSDLTTQHAAAEKDRDAVRAELATTVTQLAARTAEKDQLAGHLESFRKNLKELVGQVDRVANPAIVSGTTVSLTR